MAGGSPVLRKSLVAAYSCLSFFVIGFFVVFIDFALRQRGQSLLRVYFRERLCGLQSELAVPFARGIALEKVGVGFCAELARLSQFSLLVVPLGGIVPFEVGRRSEPGMEVERLKPQPLSRRDGAVMGVLLEVRGSGIRVVIHEGVEGEMVKGLDSRSSKIAIHQFYLLFFYMGGDALDSTLVGPIPHEEYAPLVQQALARLSSFKFKVLQALRPMPEKQKHGDLDLVCLSEQRPFKQVAKALYSKQFVHDKITGNFQFKGHQLDIHFVSSQTQFELQKFYNSYGGLGSVIGLSLKKQKLKLNNSGLFYVQIRNSLKIQVLLSDDYRQILAFVGLDFKRYQEGFTTRKDLFDFITHMKFLYVQGLVNPGKKKITKLMRFLGQYIEMHKLASSAESNALQQAVVFFKAEKKIEEQRPKLFRETRAMRRQKQQQQRQKSKQSN